jgi:hypothetical protein
MAVITPQVRPLKPYASLSYPMSQTTSRTRDGMSTYVSVVISPATTTSPVVSRVSQATRL